ncbi:MAG TPA: hypothetical protein DDW52_29495 [Planctomycetaceae bacterium]|nr:hypothetical protein [Planctomycetaceae bacterium]
MSFGKLRDHRCLFNLRKSLIIVWQLPSADICAQRPVRRLGQLAKGSLNGGSGWESNPPGPFSGSLIDFEDRGGHQTTNASD